MDHAIVIGGSMAGLLCARVLADHCGQVTIIERDSFPDAVENRRGVPQGRHTHAILASGRNVIEKFFPGISSELIRDGGIAGDISQDARWFVGGGTLVRFKTGLEGLLVSRPFLETAVRKKVLAIPNVKVRENTVVDGLESNADRSRVTGVRIGSETFPADLVVDATGRGSHSPQWLESMGYPKPVEDRVEVGLAYTTRLFRRSGEELDGAGAVIIPPDPEGKRGGVMLAQEGGRWTVTLIGHFGQRAPEELDGFIEYAQSLPGRYIYDVIRAAEPIGEAISARFPASLRRRYEKLQRFPEGYLVFGDAISSFNPIYGQGMSASALEAAAVAEVMSQGTRDLARRFFERASKVVDIPWSIAVGNDLRMKETVGPRSAGVSFINWYMSKLHYAAHGDPVAAMAFHLVGNLLAPPPSVMHPRVVWRVLKGNLRSRGREPAAEKSMNVAAGG
jgi:2-polyprenyl-6-methoxyphenol hydroxylase-like FAD-dependent oxidoreductase